MADPDEDNRIYWFRPDPRAILPLESFHVPTNLARLVRKGVFEVRVDTAFNRVMRCCADRRSTWISDEIVRVYSLLHARGYAHSIECWRDGRLSGGLYGVVLGAAFFGESMFFRERDASKVALVHLVDRLRTGGFLLLDTQYATPHLEQFGVIEISAKEYEVRLRHALEVEARWITSETDNRTTS